MEAEARVGQAPVMVACVSCGAENPDGQSYCGSCAAPLSDTATTEKQRKTVTVVFCDVVGSTALAESRDPEALELLLAAYFSGMKAIVESYGGTVQKFIGDAVVAVFGVPVAHEDDALRALLAAVQMRESLPQFGIEGRIGVNTGEIVTSTHGTIVMGDAVNVAARFQQAAAPGEILLGPQTFALARGAATVEELEPLELKGKSAPMAAFKLVAVGRTAVSPLGDRFVGREAELALLGEAWERALAEGRCELVTIVGEPGVGKSRLVEELIAALRMHAVRGHCLPYGEGITFFPVVEVVKQLGTLPEDATAAGALRSLLGELDAPTSANEIAWAFRRLLEQAAPLLVVFDDIQWGEETFLNLVENLARVSTGAPLMLLCVARPELGERRPQWPVALKLGPLPPAEVEALLPASVPDSLRARIAHAAGGNPLFLTEMIAVAAGAGDEVLVPPTLKALLAARLDQLEGAERSVLQRGSVEGELFHRGAVQALAPTETQLTTRLSSLISKDLIRSDRPVFPTDDGFRFCHLLIRDAAYEALPKATRADLHEQFAHWLDDHDAELVERDEIVGYHLEQAYRYRTELGPLDPAAEALAVRAAGRLVAAGRRARDRLDRFAAISLLERATHLDPSGGLALLPQIAELLYMVGDYPRALALLDEATKTAHECGDKATEAVAAVVRASAASQAGDPTVPFETVVEVAGRATAILDQVGSDEQLAQVLHDAAAFCGFLGRTDEAAHLFQSGMDHARLAEDHYRARACLGGLLGSKTWGSTPVNEFFAFLNGLPAELQPLISGSRFHVALMAAYSGNFAKAHHEYAEAQRFASQFANPFVVASLTMFLGIIELLEDNPISAERTLRDGYERLDKLGALSARVTHATLLAEALSRLDRDDDALEILDVADEIVQADDFDAQVRSGSVRARISARQGRLAEADRLSSVVLETIAATDAIVLHGEALLSRAEVLRASGSNKEAEAALREALKLFEQKENVVQAEQTRALLEAS